MALDLDDLIPDIDKYDEPDCYYPEIEVTLIGENGNAVNLMGIVRRELRKANVDPEDMMEFINEAMSGDYDHVLQTCMQWVTVR